MDLPTLNCLAFETLATACINSNDYDLAIKVKLELTKHIQLTMNSVSTREKLLQLGRLLRADLRISKFIITKVRSQVKSRPWNDTKKGYSLTHIITPLTLT